MILALLLTPLTAHAGHYDGPNYTSADGKVVTTTTASWSSGSTTNYWQTSNGFGGGGDSPGSYPDSYGNPGTATITCSGTITATFTWNNDGNVNDVPPPSALVMENCQTSWSGSSYFSNVSYSGSCTNPLGGSPTADPSGVGQTWAFTKYWVQSTPGTSFTVSCSPGANASATGTAQSYGYGSAGVAYTASLSPITVDLSVGLGPSYAKRFLIGQQVTATLSPGSLYPDAWNWSASGADPFKSVITNSGTGKRIELSSETGSSLVCHFAKPAAASVTCTAHLAVPAGASPAGGLTVTATRNLNTDKPSAVLDVYIGSVTDLPTSTNPTDVQLQQYYFPAPDGNAGGIEWRGTITTPSQYVLAANTYPGQWNWTQLVTNSRQEKHNNVYWQFFVDTTTPWTPINGVQVLDGGYPYAGFWYPANGIRDGNGDSPSDYLNLDPVHPDPTIRAKDIRDSFNDYLMYLPPGVGSIEVPLKEIDWFWETHATKDANGWSTAGENAQWSFGDDFPNFPLWTFYEPAGHLRYMAP